jgi:molecular chaperone GrpE
MRFLKDKYLRSVADFRNLQERTKRDMDSARTFAIQKFAVDLLESVDNFDRALSVVPADKLTAEVAEANKDLQDLHQGLRMTENILMGTLKKHGLERFDPAEDAKFDPKLHEATFMAKMEGKENGDIMFVQSKGYSLNGRILRVSLVASFVTTLQQLTCIIQGRQGRCRQERLSAFRLSSLPSFLAGNLQPISVCM